MPSHVLPGQTSGSALTARASVLGWRFAARPQQFYAVQLPAESVPTAPAAVQPQHAGSDESLQFPGAAGASLVSKGAKPAAELKFGEVKQRSLDDAMALRQKLAAGA